MNVSRVKSFLIGPIALACLLFAGWGAALADIPSETYKALNLDQETATPKQLYEALTKRYRDRSRERGRARMPNIGSPLL